MDARLERLFESPNLVIKADNGVVCSQAVAGFAVPVRALFDEQENLAVLGQQLRLNQQRTTRKPFEDGCARGSTQSQTGASGR